MPGLPAPLTACSVVTTTDLRPATRRIGSSAMTKPMVVQLGQETMPWWSASACGFTSGITSGTLGVIRQVPDLSIATAPRRAASGASSFESVPVAAKKTKSQPSKASGRARPTGRSRPSKWTVVPVERSLASGRSCGDREVALLEHLEKDFTDGAGGADDGDRLAAAAHALCLTVTAPIFEGRRRGVKVR